MAITHGRDGGAGVRRTCHDLIAAALMVVAGGVSCSVKPEPAPAPEAPAASKAPAPAPAPGVQAAKADVPSPAPAVAAAPAPKLDALEAGFITPPDKSKPHTWWHWMNGNITKEGITADLEAMRRVGVGGAQIFNVDCGVPAGPVEFMSGEWKELTAHAIREAARLGIELCIHNCAGWSSSGGPWVKPEHAMQIVVTGERAVTGPARFSDVLPQPLTRLDTYRDIAVVAFPVPSAERARMADDPPRVTGSEEAFRGDLVVDGDASTVATMRKPRSGTPKEITLAFARPFAARSLSLVAGGGGHDSGGEVQVSDDGATYRRVARFWISDRAGRTPVHVGFAKTTARHWRVRFDRGGRRNSRVAVAEIQLSGAQRLSDVAGKAAYRRADNIVPRGSTEPEESATIATAEVKDLTDRLAPDGRLTWDVPAGEWTILRLGHTPTGKTNHPAMPAGRGPEVDKMSRAAMDAFFEGMMRTVIDAAGPLAGKTLNNALIDSYEVGTQNWTPGFRDEFRKRCGYDPRPFLPTFTGRVVGSVGVSERFLWDLRRTIADLFAENYFGRFAELCRAHGMMFSVEPYGSGLFDDLQVGGLADVVMGEYWTTQRTAGHSCKLAASAAHVYARKYVGAEAFTAHPGAGRWTNHPWSMKVLGDNAFCTGINRLIFHRYAHQPWRGLVPGMTMGQWGFHFDRTNTWFEKSTTWLRYLARCQFMLQQGLYVADVCYLAGEGAPVSLRAGNPRLPPGYSYDGCPRDAVLTRMEVRDGRIVLPDGMSYRVLALAPDETATPELLTKVRDLVRAGATVVGRRPLRSPSLKNYPACDDEVSRLVEEMWGPEATESGEHALGRGKMVWGRPLEEVFAAARVAPDFEGTNDRGDARLAWIHRVAGETDIYFVANQLRRDDEFACVFRVAGRLPELWNPETGLTRPAPVWRESDGRTQVPLRLDGGGSTFVVFRKPGTGEHLVSVERRGPSVIEREPDELVITKAVYGAFSSEGDGWADLTERVKARVRRGERSVPATNQFAGGDPAPNVVKQLRVDVSADGAKRSIVVGENQTLAVPEGAEVVRAFYGILPEESELVDRTVDITAKLAARVADGKLDVVVNNELAGTDPAYLTVKELRVEYTLNGDRKRVTVGENRSLSLPRDIAAAGMPPAYVARVAPDATHLEAWAAGEFKLVFASGETPTLEVDAPPAPLLVDGPWDVSFEPKRGAPPRARFEELISWTRSDDDGVKHFSGTATYARQLDVPADRLAPGARLYLDLGTVRHFAEPVVNGASLGILWKPPFRVDVTEHVKPGANRLEVRVTNLWRNRLIGDARLPDDIEWAGKRPAKWPAWLVDGTPRESPRVTFATWHHYGPDEELDPSGLLGPVRLFSTRIVEVRGGGD